MWMTLSIQIMALYTRTEAPSDKLERPVGYVVQV